MIPNWIQVRCSERGKRMVNLDQMSDFYADGTKTMLVMSDGYRIKCDHTFDELATLINDRRNAVLNYLDKLVKAIRDAGEPA